MHTWPALLGGSHSHASPGLPESHLKNLSLDSGFASRYCPIPSLPFKQKLLENQASFINYHVTFQPPISLHLVFPSVPMTSFSQRSPVTS